MRNPFLFITGLAIASACNPFAEDGIADREREISFCLVISPSAATRVADPDEELISDVNILIFSEKGLLEDNVYLTRKDLTVGADGVSFKRKMLKDVPYDIYVCANFGYALPVSSREELEKYRYYLTYPDEYTRGIPMTAHAEGIVAWDGEPVVFELERMMAKVSLRIDRTALSPDVRMQVRRITVGGCPRSALLFSGSRAETAEEIFATGFTKVYPECDDLNRDVTLGLSRECAVYLLENRQGDLLREPVCSYIELELEYFSDIYYSGAGQYLVYRFYIGARPGNYDIFRNCHYHITVRPEGDGLHGDSWSVELEHLGVREDAKVFDLHPAQYNECRSGEDFHLHCDVFPPWTRVEFDREWLEGESHLYSYTFDEDGLGITLHTKKGGTAMFYISAGPPVNRDTLALLVIDP